MTDCNKCTRTDVKCCFTCKKEKCKVWHICGSDCPEHESKMKTNADRIRSMSDEELVEFLVNFKNTYGDEYEGEMSYLGWLKSEVENKIG